MLASFVVETSSRISSSRERRSSRLSVELECRGFFVRYSIDKLVSFIKLELSHIISSIRKMSEASLSTLLTFILRARLWLSTMDNSCVEQVFLRLSKMSKGILARHEMTSCLGNLKKFAELAQKVAIKSFGFVILLFE